MVRGQKLIDLFGNQVALFPLDSFIITQTDQESYSHDPQHYLATDYQAFHYTSGNESTPGTGYVLNFAPYFASVDMVCVGMDKTNASICWRSKEKVHLANGLIDYLILLFYHDNKVPQNYYQVGQQVSQGDIIGYTGTYGNNGSTVANHVHMESGYGENWDKVYASPYYGHINIEYALHNYDAMFGNDIIDYGIPSYRSKYPWVIFRDGFVPVGGTENFKWFLFTKTIKQRRK